jgi:hypothetical protein
LGDGAFVPLQDIDNSFQYSGTVSWTKGNHNIKAGIALIRRQARNVQSASAAGFYQFNLPSDSGPTQLQTQNNQLASALVGAFSQEQRNFNLSPPDYRSWEPSGFVQDSWKVSQKLTLLAGVRMTSSHPSLKRIITYPTSTICRRCHPPRQQYPTH